MSERVKSGWCITVLYGIVVGLVLALPACTDFKKDFLCRTAGHCVNAADGGTSNTGRRDRPQSRSWPSREKTFWLPGAADACTTCPRLRAAAAGHRGSLLPR